MTEILFGRTVLQLLSVGLLPASFTVVAVGRVVVADMGIGFKDEEVVDKVVEERTIMANDKQTTFVGGKKLFEYLKSINISAISRICEIYYFIMLQNFQD